MPFRNDVEEHIKNLQDALRESEGDDGKLTILVILNDLMFSDKLRSEMKSRIKAIKDEELKETDAAEPAKPIGQ